YDELPVYYGLANVFVHTSKSEPWGLVVNEATASGLPVVVSQTCGCVPELVHDGVNGFTFDPIDEDQLTDRLRRVASMTVDDRGQLSQASYNIALKFEASIFGQGLHQAAQAATSWRPRKSTAVAKLLLSILLLR